MKITVQATQEELDTMGMEDVDELGRIILDVLEGDGYEGTFSSYSVHPQLIDTQ